MNYYTYINNKIGCIIFKCNADNIIVADVIYYVMKGIQPSKDSGIAVIINFGECNAKTW